jgi:hypothetical protein
MQPMQPIMQGWSLTPNYSMTYLRFRLNNFSTTIIDLRWWVARRGAENVMICGSNGGIVWWIGTWYRMMDWDVVSYDGLIVISYDRLGILDRIWDRWGGGTVWWGI